MSRIVVQLMGGLGNQMFQYAFGRYLARRHDTELFLDDSQLRRKDTGWVPRDYSLDIFRLHRHGLLLRESTYDRPPAMVLQERSIEFDVCLRNTAVRGDLLLKGFWQSPLYFCNDSEFVSEDFQLRDDLLAGAPNGFRWLQGQLESCESVMVNVRRQDYLQTSFHGVLAMDYYGKAMDMMRKRHPGARFYVFSDDVEWCSEAFTDSDTRVIGHDYAGDRFCLYLQLMRSCRHFILANSSFAWWAAYLGEKPGAAVIGPKRWFTGTPTDIIPAYLGWRLI